MAVADGINLIKTTYNELKPILEDETIKRYGSMLLKVGMNGAKKLIGHLETAKAGRGQTALLTASGGMADGAGQLASGQLTSMTQQLMQSGGSAAIGGLASFGWANLAMTGISIGVTVASTVILSKKIDKLSQEVQQINGRLDGIIEEMHEIKLMVAQLNDNEIRKLYKETDTEIAYMYHCMSKLSQGKYNDYTVGETEKLLISASKTLTDNLSRYNASDCDIALGLDIIMAHFYAFVSLLKTYMSAVYLHEGDQRFGGQYDTILRNMCSRTMVESIQNAYRQALSSSSFVAPTDIGLVTAVYRGIMTEQIGELKAQRKILELADYNDYKRINEAMQDDTGNSDLILWRSVSS